MSTITGTTAEYVTGICCTLVIVESVYFVWNYPYRIPLPHRIALLIVALFILSDAAVRLVTAALTNGSSHLIYIRLVPAISSFFLALMLLWLIPTTLQFIRYIARLEIESTQRLEQLTMANKRAERAVDDKNRFLGSMSHELRNPLNVIVQTVDLLVSGELDPVQRERALAVQENSLMMTTLLDDTITVTRMESGRVVLERIPVDLRRLTRTQVQDVASRAQQKGVMVELRYEPDVPRYVLSDPTRLKQLMVNLLTNAIKFTRDNSRVSVYVSIVEHSARRRPIINDSIELLVMPASEQLVERGTSQDPTHPVYHSMSSLGQFSEEARSLHLDYTESSTDIDPDELVVEQDDVSDRHPVRVFRISVVDQGVGISAASLPHLFHPFTQAMSSTTRLHGGSGLGLSICALIMRAFHGSIEATSQIDRGSEFSFLVPMPVLTDEQFRNLSDLSYDGSSLFVEERKSSCSLPILVVDDSMINCKLLVQVLHTLGYTTISTANNGLEAVRAFEQQSEPFWCCFMDIQMPVMDGIEATRQLRARGHNTHIVALTGNSTADNRAECVKAGMNAFLTKPFRKEMLKQLLSTLSGSD